MLMETKKSGNGCLGFFLLILIIGLPIYFLVGSGSSGSSNTGSNKGYAATDKNAPDSITLLTYAEISMEKILHQKVKFSLYDSNYDISQTFLRFVIRAEDVKIGTSVRNSVIVKLEFENDKYDSGRIFQLKVNGVNIYP